MGKVKTSAFDSYRLFLPDDEKEALDAFFMEYNHHNFMDANEKALMRRDFEQAILTCVSLGVPLFTALERLAISNLGGFYARPSLRWFPLDNAAKIYPFSMAHGRMAVFRISMYLKEDVIPALLQMALTFTIKRFPSFATTIKKGFFWHYLDTSKRRYLVETEKSVPCGALKVAGSGSQSFRVLTYKNRISVEFFHVLTDGFGGTVFCKTLLAEYLRLLGVEAPRGDGVLDINENPSEQEVENAFALVPKTKKGSGFVDKTAVQMSGKLSRYSPCRVLHFNMNVEQLKMAAARYQATVTSYLLAMIFLAAQYATDETEGTLNVQVPVNMRKFYPSDTLRNFSMYCGIRLPLRQMGDAGALMEEITKQLAEKTSQNVMSEMVTSAGRIVAALRFIPLLIKAPAVKLVNGILSDKIFSTTLSNLGVVTLPPQLMAHVLHMDFVLGPAVTNRAGCALVTCGGTATLSVTKATPDPSFEEKLYDLLAADGVAPEAEGSALCED